MERGALRESGFEGQWDLIAGIRKRETFKGHTQGLIYIRNQGGKQWLHKHLGLGQTYLLV